jgi:hypothetical protein
MPLSLGALASLAQDEEPGGSGDEPESGGGVGARLQEKSNISPA